MADDQDQARPPEEPSAEAAPQETPLPEPAPVAPVARRRSPRWLRPVIGLAIVAVLAVVLWTWWPLSPKALLASSLARMAAARSTSGQVKLTMDMDLFEPKFELRFAAQKPERMTMDLGMAGQKMVRCWSDGQRLTFEAVALRQAFDCPVPREWKDLAPLFADLPGADKFKERFEQAKAGKGMGLSRIQASWGLDPSDKWLKSLPSLPRTKVVRATFDGLPVFIWIDRWSHLPRRFAVRMQDVMKMALAQAKPGEKADPKLAEMQAMMSQMQLNLCFDVTTLELNRAMSPSLFQPKLDQGVTLTHAATYGDGLKQVSQNAMSGGGRSRREPERKDLTGKTIPDFTAQDLQGRPVKLSSFRGKPVVLDFWATWCPPCRQEMPILEELYGKLKAQGLQVVAVSSDSDRETITTWLKTNPVSFTVLWLDPAGEAGSKLSTELGIEAIPRTLYLAKDGTVKADTVGLHPKTAMVEQVAKLGIDVGAAR